MECLENKKKDLPILEESCGLKDCGLEEMERVYFALDDSNATIGCILSIINKVRGCLELSGVSEDEYRILNFREMLILLENKTDYKIITNYAKKIKSAIDSKLKEKGILRLEDGREISLKVLTKWIKDLMLFPKLKNNLQENGIYFLGELVLQTEEFLKEELGLTDSQLKQIKMILNNNDLALGMKGADAEAIQSVIAEYCQKKNCVILA